MSNNHVGRRSAACAWRQNQTMMTVARSIATADIDTPRKSREGGYEDCATWEVEGVTRALIKPNLSEDAMT